MSSNKVLAGLRKTYGDNIGGVGGGTVPPTRIPTGIFPLDLALYGGIPRGRVTIIYGMESSGKSVVLYKLMARVQSEGKVAVLIDIEGSYDKDWARQLGVDTGKLVYILPATAEEVVDAVDGFMNAEDVGLVALDSIAAMSTTNEVESEASKASVGGAANIVTKMLRKVTSAINRQRREGRAATFVAINQVRYKIGVMYGDPETMPGGMGVKFFASMTLRLYGKNKVVKEISGDTPAFREISGVVKKFKVPIVNTAFTYDLCLIPHNNLKVGDVDAWNSASHYAKNFGIIKKVPNGYMVLGDVFKTVEAIKEKYYDDVKFAGQLHQAVIKLAKPTYKDDSVLLKAGKKPLPKKDGEGEED